MKSGSHTAIRFFILNPPVRVTSLQRSGLALTKAGIRFNKRGSPNMAKELGSFHSYTVPIATAK
jgi:hypothetical protein